MQRAAVRERLEFRVGSDSDLFSIASLLGSGELSLMRSRKIVAGEDLLQRTQGRLKVVSGNAGPDVAGKTGDRF